MPAYDCSEPRCPFSDDADSPERGSEVACHVCHRSVARSMFGQVFVRTVPEP